MSQTHEIPQVFIARVYLKNGTQYNFWYRDPGRAHDVANTIGTAARVARQGRAAEGACKVVDDAGRESWIQGDEVAMAQFIDCAAELREDIRMTVVLSRTDAALREAAGLPPRDQQPAPNGHAAEPETAPAIGRPAPAFAS
jgi:hypothetical protein